jgi:hypothetical protein
MDFFLMVDTFDMQCIFKNSEVVENVVLVSDSMQYLYLFTINFSSRILY